MAYSTKEEILIRAQELVGIPIGDIDRLGMLKSGKGAIGNTIQANWFNIPVNSKPLPDFEEAGVELKAHPFRYDKKHQVCAKERLVCDIIDYMKEWEKTFETSSFYSKCHDMLLLPYEDTGLLKETFYVAKAILFSFPEEDLIIIKNDWKKIIDKIRNGKAHEISEADTFYLGACTKGKDSTSVRKQPFSDILAKQRAYCLKTSYMTYLLRTYIFGGKTDEHIISCIDEFNGDSFENVVAKKISKYKDKSINELCDIFNVKFDKKPKNLESILAFRILGIKNNKAEEFVKAGIVVKSIRINNNNTITEHMSFPAFKFNEIANEDWEESKFRSYLSETKFFFIIYKYDENGVLKLKGCQFWNMPFSDLDTSVKSMWQKTKQIILDGSSFNFDGKFYRSALPKQSDNSVSHVRPHGINSTISVNALPNGMMFPNQCFWLNNSYILSQIDKTIYINKQ